MRRVCTKGFTFTGFFAMYLTSEIQPCKIVVAACAITSFNWLVTTLLLFFNQVYWSELLKNLKYGLAMLLIKLSYMPHSVQQPFDLINLLEIFKFSSPVLPLCKILNRPLLLIPKLQNNVHLFKSCSSHHSSLRVNMFPCNAPPFWNIRKWGN